MEVDCTVTHISYRESGILSHTALALQELKKEVFPFIHRPFEWGSFSEQMAEKQKDYSNRSILTQALKEQYKGLKPHKAVKANLEILARDTTFTVTTGHQLCMFGGPLYFVYKIVHTINLAKALKEQHPNNDFVPVFWMATEDHDYEEIKGVNVLGQHFAWEAKHTSEAVGRMSTEGISQLAEDILKVFPEGGSKEALQARINRWLTNISSPIDFIRNMVNDLFGKYGVVAIDGDDAALKRCMIPYFKEELLHQFSFKNIERTSAQLIEAGFTTQVNPREINLFYLHDNGKRERIEREAKGFVLVDSQQQFTETELLTELENHPQRFSPNVVLRPLFQEVVLPNLLYLGGGGEMAYWLQLKDMFADAQVPFPIVAIRNSVLYLQASCLSEVEQMELHLKDLFADEQTVVQTIVDKFEGDAAYNLDAERAELEKWMSGLIDKATQKDEALTRYVKAREVWQQQFLDALQKKMYRRSKANQQANIHRFEKTKEALFPKGKLQERYDGMLYHLYQKQDLFVDYLVDTLDPMNASLTIVLE